MAIGKDPIASSLKNNILQSFSDATAGRSIQTFYAMAATDSTGANYVLGRDAGNSDPAYNKTLGGFSIDAFAITINKPTIFAGICSIDFTTQVEGPGGQDAMTVVFTLEKENAGGDTTIGTVTSRTHTGSVVSAVPQKVKFDITRVLFKVGEILKLKIDVTNTEGGRFNYLYYDPDTAGHELILNIPVVNLE